MRPDENAWCMKATGELGGHRELRSEEATADVLELVGRARGQEGVRRLAAVGIRSPPTSSL
jgi:hypothetical protein